jgi:hypothetical protein
VARALRHAVVSRLARTLGQQPNALRGASNSARFGWRATRHQAGGLQRSPRVGTASPRASRCSARNLIGHCFVRPRRRGPPVLRQSARRSRSGSNLNRAVCGAARCGRVAGHHVAQHEPAWRLPTRRSVATCPTPHSSGRPEGRRLARTLGKQPNAGRAMQPSACFRSAAVRPQFGGRVTLSRFGAVSPRGSSGSARSFHGRSFVCHRRRRPPVLRRSAHHRLFGTRARPCWFGALHCVVAPHATARHRGCARRHRACQPNPALKRTAYGRRLAPRWANSQMHFVALQTRHASAGARGATTGGG